jgi:hypothetical protein
MLRVREIEHSYVALISHVGTAGKTAKGCCAAVARHDQARWFSKVGDASTLVRIQPQQKNKLHDTPVFMIPQ